MKKHKRKIQTGIEIGIFSVIIIACLISIFSRMYTENKEKEAFRQLAEIVTEYLGPMDAKKIEDLKTVLDMYMSEFTEEKESEEESIEEKEQEGEDK
mgnify:FL=1